MNRYGRLQALTLSFYSRALYRDVAQNWKGAGLLYLWNVLALSWMACAFATHSRSDALDRIIDQVPPIRIEHGVAFVDAQQPFKAAVHYPSSFQSLDEQLPKTLNSPLLQRYPSIGWSPVIGDTPT